MRQSTATQQQHDAFTGVLERLDAWLRPVTVGPAFAHRSSGTPIPAADRGIPYEIGAGSYVTRFNLTGGPVVVLPMGRSGEGLPIGVQLVGRRSGEIALLEVARRVAEVAGPFRRPSEASQQAV